jgi:hypothetical protein
MIVRDKCIKLICNLTMNIIFLTTNYIIEYLKSYITQFTISKSAVTFVMLLKYIFNVQ